MSQQNEMKDEKLNKLNLNKETISDLEVTSGRDVVGGFVPTQEPTVKTLPTQSNRPPCKSYTCPIKA